MTEQEAFAKLSALCASAERCGHDMAEKMRRWGLTDDERERVMSRLTEGRFVDDGRYALAFALDKARHDRWGRLKIERALAMKGITGETARAALAEISREEYVAALSALLKTKRRSTRAASDYELRAKLTRFAMGRGFDMDVIRECVGDLDDDCPLD